MIFNSPEYYLKIGRLMDNGELSFVRVINQGRLAVTSRILAASGFDNGQEITPEAARALIQIHEAALRKLQAALTAT